MLWKLWYLIVGERRRGCAYEVRADGQSVRIEARNAGELYGLVTTLGTITIKTEPIERKAP